MRGIILDRSKLAQGIRFAGERAAAAAENCNDWDFKLGPMWTTRDAFAHIAATAGGAAQIYGALESGMLSKLGVSQVAATNAQRISAKADATHEELIAQIQAGQEASAAFVETLDESDLAKVVTLGGYTMSKAEILAQIWIHHQIAHAYEATARWPIV